MDALDVLKSWPTWAHAGHEAVLASPAWRRRVRLGETEVSVVRAAALPAEALTLDVTFDGAPGALALIDSALFPDLHLLWAQRAALPPNVLLALVEKECGDLFLLLEKLVRRQFGVKGLAATPLPENAYAFAVEGLAAPLTFALALPAEALPAFGGLDCLDPAHPAIRAATREIRADYGALALTEADCAALKVGDSLLMENPPAPQWLTESPADDVPHVLAADSRTATFAEFADDALPPPPPPAEPLALVRGDRALARLAPTHIGLCPAFRIVSLLAR